MSYTVEDIKLATHVKIRETTGEYKTYPLEHHENGTIKHTGKTRDYYHVDTDNLPEPTILADIFTGQIEYIIPEEEVPSEFIIDKLENGFKNLYAVKIHTDEIGMNLIQSIAEKLDNMRKLQSLKEQKRLLEQQIKEVSKANKDLNRKYEIYDQKT